MTTEEAVKVLEDMIVKISIPKAAELQHKRNEAIAMAIEALNSSEIPNNSDTIYRKQAIDALENYKEMLDQIIRLTSANDKQLDHYVAQHDQVVYDIDVIKQLQPIQPANCSEIPNNSDTVSRQALLDAFGLSEKTRKYGGDHSGYNTMMLYEIQDVIEGMPPTEPVIRCKTGYWVWADGLRCSECGYKLMQTSVPQICPHCHSNNGGGA